MTLGRASRMRSGRPSIFLRFADRFPTASSRAESVSFRSALIFVLTRVSLAEQYERTVSRILLTTTSFQDTPGAHHQLLQDAGFKIVHDRGRRRETQRTESE